jgi:hypothetical protein
MMKSNVSVPVFQRNKFHLHSPDPNSVILKMGAAYSSEVSEQAHYTTQHVNPK